MIRQGLSLFLASILTVPAYPLFAQDINANPTLEERLRNMSKEVERFLSLMPESECALSYSARAQVTSSKEGSDNALRLRARLGITPLGTEISLSLQDGQTVEGKLAEVTEDGLVVEYKDRTVGTSGRQGWALRLKKDFRFDEVESAEIPWTGGWMAPENIGELSSGKKVEVLLLSGEKVRGRFAEASEQGFTVTMEKDHREFAVDEVAGVRKLGMSRGRKALIIGGAIGGFFLTLTALYWNS